MVVGIFMMRASEFIIGYNLESKLMFVCVPRRAFRCFGKGQSAGRRGGSSFGRKLFSLDFCGEGTNHFCLGLNVLNI